MTHLEALISEFLEWQGFLIRRNVKVGPLKHGGYEMELDVVGFNPETGELVQYEPSLDALSWERREARYKKKFAAGKRHILKTLFPWLSRRTPLRQVAVFPSHPPGHDHIAGGRVVSVDELMATIRARVVAAGLMARGAIPEQFPLLRTLQLSHAGYLRLEREQPARAQTKRKHRRRR